MKRSHILMLLLAMSTAMLVALPVLADSMNGSKPYCLKTQVGGSAQYYCNYDTWDACEKERTEQSRAGTCVKKP